ncbi:uncharacterized protein At2g29880-like [Gossypium raimondii]|uniref:uncharacterized protein At2g29880-like n=1 Tax=Gossypium raimondii TaxID=29730 RepID=UPI00227A2E31|nr:uncharacterized protein At2g29880-like [Gossypium raimondii]
MGVGNWSAICEQLLGNVSNKFSDIQIEMKWLEENFNYIDNSASIVEREQYARAFILRSLCRCSESNAQASRGSKRKWVRGRCEISFKDGGLHNVGTFNVDTGFKAGYLNELERMLQTVLPNAMLKAKPNIESRIRLLKREWSIVYDMLNGQNNSGFGWDEHRQLVVAEDAVWESYLKSHKEAAQFRFRTFPYYDQLTTIYARDRATGRDAQTAADVLEEIHADDVRTTDMNEERNTFYDCEADVSLDDMHVSGTDPRGDRDQGGSSSSNKRKKKSDARDNVFSSFNEAATLFGEKIQAVGDQISRSFASEVVVQQKSEQHMEEIYLRLPIGMG